MFDDIQTYLPEGFFDALPIAIGWRLVVFPLPVEEATKGGIVLAPTNAEAQRYNTAVGKIISMGPIAFKHPDFLPERDVALDGMYQRFNDSWRNELAETIRQMEAARMVGVPKIGDWVVFGKHTGQRFRCVDVELFFMSDRDIIGVAPKPEELRIKV